MRVFATSMPLLEGRVVSAAGSSNPRGARVYPHQALKGRRAGAPGTSLPPETLGRKPQLPGRLAPAHKSSGQTASTARWRRLSQERGRTGFPGAPSGGREHLPQGREDAPPGLLKYAPERRGLLGGLTDQSIGEALLRSGDGGRPASRRPLQPSCLPARGSRAATFQLAS
jgi:hypothetical protein